MFAYYNYFLYLCTQVYVITKNSYIMEKKTRNILIVIVAIVVLVPVLLILLGLGSFILSDIMYSGDGEGVGNLLKYIGIAIIVIGGPLTLFLTRKKK